MNPTNSDTVRAASEVSRSGQIAMQDFYRQESDHRVYLAVMVPILDELAASRPLGVLVLRIDPTTYLYPFLRRWPTPSPTAETLLVRRDSNDVLFLSETKFQPDTALNLRVSLENTEFPVVKAALGQQGILEGLDYCGCPTFAAVVTIPDSPWSLEARIDAAEVYGPLAEQLWRVVGFSGVLLLATGACVGLVWREQHARLLQNRLEAAEVLRQAEAKYRSVFDHVAEGIFQTTPDGRFLLANSALARMLGFASPEELIADRTDIGRQGYVRPERREEFKRLMEEQSEVTGFEYEVLRKDGRVVWVSETARAVRDAAGEVVFYEGLFEDIDARKHAEELVRESEEQYRLLFNSSPDAIFVHEFTAEELPGRFIEANEEACRRYGYPRAELLQMRPMDIDAREGLARIPAAMQRLKADGHAHWEGVHLTRDGRRIDVDIINAVFDFRGRPMILASVRDITERKHAEAELRETNRQLEQATARANEMAVQSRMATRAKSEFLANMSHEIRTPMTAILGYADLLMEESVDPAMQEQVAVIKRNGEQLLGLINDILDLSKVEAGKMQIQPIRCSPGELVAEVVSLMRVRAAEKHLNKLRQGWHVPELDWRRKGTCTQWTNPSPTSPAPDTLPPPDKP